MKKRYYARRRVRRRTARTRFYVIIIVLAVALAVGIFFIVQAASGKPGTGKSPSSSATMTAPSVSGQTTASASATAEATPSPSPTTVPSLSNDLVPKATGKTDPNKLGFKTGIMDNNAIVDSYSRSEAITFGPGSEYTDLEGIITFRGNNYRDAASYGTAKVTNEKLKLMTTKNTGNLTRWSGSGWTGQPIIVKWPEKTRQIMTTLFEKFRTKQDFVEVIYPTMDGNIYFMELSTGEKTREPIKMGYTVKGTASLDPRGYPMLYVGQGIGMKGNFSDDNTYYYAYNLITGQGTKLFGAPAKDPFAYRKWQAYDSSALIDAEADTLIEPGENGVLYTMKLNSSYDEAAGTMSINPGPITKYRYTTPRCEAVDNGRYGTENSAVTWRNYIFYTDNAGYLQCVDLNTMKLVYANDVTDDSDVSMVLEEDPANQTFYLYTGNEYDPLVRKLGTTAPVYARKINGLTGEILWEKEFKVKSGSIDGGILASPVVGKEGTTLEGLVVYNVCALSSGTSKVVALNKDNGDIVWEYNMVNAGWSPSSPVPVYSDKKDANGKTIAYIVQCEIGGVVTLIRADGDSCKVADQLKLGTEAESNNFEASPAIYGNTIVVGSKSKHIFFITIE